MTRDAEFLKELEDLINRYSAENESNTPDFILAKFLYGCLQAWNAGVQRREVWFDRCNPLAMDALTGLDAPTEIPTDLEVDIPTADKKEG